MKHVTTAGASAAQSPSRVRVWELPLRVFHWGLVACFVTVWLTTGDRNLDLHVLAGYLLSGLIVFRLVWGFAGEFYSRFRNFRFGWNAVYSYLGGVTRGRPEHFTGHNPAASWAVWLMLLMLILIAVSGLLTLGGEEQHGPLAGWITIAPGVALHEVHEVLAWLMLGIVGVHISGVLVESLLQRENLVRAMLTGHKKRGGGDVPVRNRRITGLLMVVAALLFAGWWARGYLVQTSDRPYLPFIGAQLPDDPLWREECGACHLAFHPGLLPARSWTRLMDEQASHFDEDLALDEATVTQIRDFLVSNSSEHTDTEAAYRINRSIAADATLLRITETPYWKAKHAEVDAAVWNQANVNGKSDCAACHRDAERGTFEDAAMRVPASPPAQSR